MANTDFPLIGAIGQRGRPLCRAYLLVLVESLAVELEDDAGGRSDGRLYWALGVLPDGEYEVLGGWPESPPHGIAWDQMLKELKFRGVERIRLVVAGGLAMAEPVVRAARLNAISLPSTTGLVALTSGQPARCDDKDGASELRRVGTARKAPMTIDVLAGGSIRGSAGAGADERKGAAAQAPGCSFAMSAGHHRTVRAAQKAAQSLGRLACRAVARHGAFSEPADATAFVVDALIHAEQKTRATGASIDVATQNRDGATRRRSGSVRSGAPRL